MSYLTQQVVGFQPDVAKSAPSGQSASIDYALHLTNERFKENRFGPPVREIQERPHRASGSVEPKRSLRPIGNSIKVPILLGVAILGLVQEEQIGLERGKVRKIALCRSDV